MGIDEYLIALRRHWRVVVAAVVLAVAIAWLTSRVAPDQSGAASYNATAVMLNTGSFSAVPGSTTSLDTVATLATLDPVTQRVARAIGYDGDPRTLAAKVNAVADADSPGIVRITASSVDPNEAARIANTFATELIAYLHSDRQRTAQANLDRVNEQLVQVSADIAAIDARLPTASATRANVLEAQRTALTSQVSSLSGLYQQYLRESLEPPSFQVIEQATAVPVVPEGLQPPRSRMARVLAAAALGLAGGLVLALFLHRFDRRIRTSETAERAFREPVLAEIPRMPRTERRGVVMVEHPHSPSSEALRLLSASLLQGPVAAPPSNGGRRREVRREDRRSKIVVVTSAAPGEGKTTVVANLAVAVSETGKSVLILSCDFRRPTIHGLLEVPNLRGLSDVLKEPGTGPPLDGCVMRTRFQGVEIVPSGPALDRPGEILASDAMPRLLREARGKADLVLIDTAPILAASETAHLIPWADVVLVVARAGVVTTSLAHRTHETLDRLHTPKVSVVLNAAEETVVPPGYREYFRRIPDVSADEEGVGDSPLYRVPQQKDTI